MSHLEDWADLDRDGAIAIESQERTAVYQSKGGAIVIRQQLEYDDDVFVSIDPANVMRLCRALIEAAQLDVQIVPLSALRVVNGAGEVLAPFDAQSIAATRPDPLVLPRPKDKTAAERKRRQRQKQNAANVTAIDRDNVRDSVTVTPELPAIFDQYREKKPATAG